MVVKMRFANVGIEPIVTSRHGPARGSAVTKARVRSPGVLTCTPVLVPQARVELAT
jgi:hypothetical protein